MGIERFAGRDIDRLRAAGRAARATLIAVAQRLRPGMSTADIDSLVRADTAARGAAPSQLGYQGFPAAVCTSRNEVVCHGIPDREELLREGDILNVDVTSHIGGFHGDTSHTFAIGPISEAATRLLCVAHQCRDLGIAQIRDGARLGDIGAAIQEYAESRGCSVVRDYCGHGIGRVMHAPPQVAHFGKRGTGRRLRSGMVITVEPMINAGSAETVLDARDGWTVRTADGDLSAQFEHTVLVTEHGPAVLTLVENDPLARGGCLRQRPASTIA